MANEAMKTYGVPILVAIVLGAVAIGGMNVLAYVNGTTSLTVTSSVSISMPTNSVNLGSLAQSETNSTLSNNPTPFVVQNDGNVKANVTINASDLFSTQVNPSTYYQFLANTSSEGVCWFNASAGAATTWTDMPTAIGSEMFLTYLNFSTCKTAEVEIKVTIPTNEPTGGKSSIVTLQATEA